MISLPINEKKIQNNEIIQQYLQQANLKLDDIVDLSYIKPDLQHDEDLLTGIEEMNHHLVNIYHSEDEITIYPDYDADGVCSGILTYFTLGSLGYNVNLVPPETSHGYGLNYNVLKDLYPNTKYIFTTDNGINKQEEVKEAYEDGVQTLITDHHLGEMKHFPDLSIAIVNPNRSDIKENYPFNGLSGTGVAYKVMLKLAKSLKRQDVVEDLENYASALVGISTISDVMTVKDENRYFIKKTIDTMNRTDVMENAHNEDFQYLHKALDIMYLKSAAGLEFGIGHLGFAIAPVLNSPRRINETSKEAFEFFINPSEESYEKLIKINQKRKDIVSKIVSSISFEYDNKNAIVYRDSSIPHGIAGLIASRLARQYEKPAIVLCEDGGGSARSVKGYSIHDGLKYVEEVLPESLEGWGGHHMAAGLKIRSGYAKQIESLLDSYFEDHYDKKSDDVKSNIRLHYNPQNKKDVFDAIDVFNQIEPFNEKDIPLFEFDVDLSTMNYTLMKGIHLKVELGKGVSLIAWNTSPNEDFSAKIYCTAQINHFRGYKNLQFIASEIVE